MDDIPNIKSVGAAKWPNIINVSGDAIQDGGLIWLTPQVFYVHGLFTPS